MTDPDFDWSNLPHLRRPMDGFDLDLVGFDCRSEIAGEPWKCPFDPGCGATTMEECPLMKRRRLIVDAPEGTQ